MSPKLQRLLNRKETPRNKAAWVAGSLSGWTKLVSIGYVEEKSRMIRSRFALVSTIALTWIRSFVRPTGILNRTQNTVSMRSTKSYGRGLLKGLASIGV